MIKIINKVIENRLKKNDDNKTIQLSPYFFKELLTQFNEKSNKIIEYNNFMQEIKYNINNNEYKIIHRNHRDCTNDEDVEHIMFNLIKNNENEKIKKLWAFYYCSCIYESSYATMSLHKTKEGAKKAMKKHKKQEKKKFYKMFINKEEALKRGLKFGQHEDWNIGEIEILD